MVTAVSELYADGATDDQIRSALKEQGYGDNDINSIISSAKPASTQQSSTSSTTSEAKKKMSFWNKIGLAATAAKVTNNMHKQTAQEKYENFWLHHAGDGGGKGGGGSR